jgi:ABC-2 type transport system ATP-binding protein
MRKSALPALEIDRVGKSFGGRRAKKVALQDVSVQVGQGEIFGFLGPNGAGKSTLIKLLLGFITPDSGYLAISGKKVGAQEYRHLIGYLAEVPFFFDHLSARETLMLSARLSGCADLETRKRIPLLLERVNLSEATHVRVKELSKGMKQRLGMANALIHDPEILIFDEPMSGLDPMGRHLFKKFITELKEQGKTVFFSSHILNDIQELCHKIGILNRGRLLYRGQHTELCGTAKNLEDAFVELIERDNNERSA